MTPLKLRGFLHQKILQSTSHKFASYICKTYSQQRIFLELIKNSFEKGKQLNRKMAKGQVQTFQRSGRDPNSAQQMGGTQAVFTE